MLIYYHYYYCNNGLEIPFKIGSVSYESIGWPTSQSKCLKCSLSVCKPPPLMSLPPLNSCPSHQMTIYIFLWQAHLTNHCLSCTSDNWCVRTVLHCDSTYCISSGWLCEWSLSVKYFNTRVVFLLLWSLTSE